MNQRSMSTRVYKDFYWKWPREPVAEGSVNIAQQAHCAMRRVLGVEVMENCLRLSYFTLTSSYLLFKCSLRPVAHRKPVSTPYGSWD